MRTSRNIESQNQHRTTVIIKREIPPIRHPDAEFVPRFLQIRQRVVDQPYLARDSGRVQHQKRAVPQPQQPRRRRSERLLQSEKRVPNYLSNRPANHQRRNEEMRPDFGEAVQDSPGHVQPRGDLRQSGGDRRSDDSGEAVEDLEQRG